MGDEIPSEHERATDLDQWSEIEDQVGARTQETKGEDRAARSARARVDLAQPGGKLARLGHRENEPRSTEQVTQDRRERSEDRRGEDDPIAPLPHRVPRRREHRRVLPSDLVRTEHPEGDRANAREHHRSDRDAANDGDGDRSPRLFDLAGHDRHPHEAVPGPKEDRRPNRHAEGSLVAEDRRKRSEEHTSELQSQSNLVCRLLLEKKKTTTSP